MPGHFNQDDILYDGILHKRSRYLNVARRRRMILTHECLYAFPVESDCNHEDATEIFDLKNIKEIIEMGYREENDIVRYPLTIRIRNLFHDRYLVLETTTPRERNRWITALSTYGKVTRAPGFEGEYIDQVLHGCPFDTSEDCIICFHPLADSETVMRLHCKHAFCTPCLHEWAEQQRLCPLCKRLF